MIACWYMQVGLITEVKKEDRSGDFKYYSEATNCLQALTLGAMVERLGHTSGVVLDFCGKVIQGRQLSSGGRVLRARPGSLP